MMSGVKLDVLWSPIHHDKFVIWGPDITLYEVSRIKEIEKKTTFTPISATRGATVIASQSASGVRCVDISAIPEQPEPLLALGYTSGRVALTSLKQTYDPLGLVGREFSSRHPRLCNSVSWSHQETNMLAVAMEKHRSDHCILLWDVYRGSMLCDEARAGESASQTPDPAKPVAEMGLSETAHCVTWANFSPRTLIASMNLKYIKIFDLRDLSNKAVSTASSRYCYGVCAEPCGGWQVAARGEGVACVWDARNLHAPLLTLHHPKPLTHLQWCPTRRNLLLSLQRDSSTLRVHDIQQASENKMNLMMNDNGNATAVEAELEEQYSRGPSVIERDVTPSPSVPVVTFSCHPADEARLLCVCANGSLVDYTVCERVTVAWGGNGTLLWTGAGGLGGGGALRMMRDDFYAAIGDVSYVMKRRAQTDYGLKPDLWQNADLADDDALSGLWHFLALSKSLVEDGCIRNSPWKHPGVRTVLRSAGDGGYRSEMVPSILPDLPNRRVTIYRSVERTRALQLCGWGWGWENALAGVERAEAEGTPCRAAALAAFQLRVRAALDVLGRARDPSLRVAALALAGLSDERLWRDAHAHAHHALPDPYLRALLRFLAASAPAHPQAPPASPAPYPDLGAVLEETGMRLEDRVAFACIFLSDTKLHDYIRQTCDSLIEEGDLSGILLTGASPEGVSLLQRWAERGGDVQSVALVAARCFTPDLLKDPRALNWLDSYRTILDSWQLWWARCALDTWVCAAEGGGEWGSGGGVPRHVCVACTYCGKSVAAPPGHNRPRVAFARLPPPAAKMKQISSCPHCRKPLARCGVCSLHLGTGAGGAGAGAGGAGGAGAGAAHFAGWFSWCVACRHGGHAMHLINWFKEHVECPVSSCNCHCAALDPPDRC